MIGEQWKGGGAYSNQEKSKESSNKYYHTFSLFPIPRAVTSAQGDQETKENEDAKAMMSQRNGGWIKEERIRSDVQ